MKEVFEKIVERLEDTKDIPHDDSVAEAVSTEIWNKAIQRAIGIVQEVAKKYVPGTNVGNSDWIACSERLPEDNGVYFVTYDDDVMPRYIDIRKFRNGKFDQNLVVSPLHDKFPEKEVAWMPLPKPYNGN